MSEAYDPQSCGSPSAAARGGEEEAAESRSASGATARGGEVDAEESESRAGSTAPATRGGDEDPQRSASSSATAAGGARARLPRGASSVTGFPAPLAGLTGRGGGARWTPVLAGSSPSATRFRFAGPPPPPPPPPLTAASAARRLVAARVRRGPTAAPDAGAGVAFSLSAIVGGRAVARVWCGRRKVGEGNGE